MRLQPENDALEPIYAQHVQLIGKVIGSLPAAVSVEALNRTLEQELFALLRGASLECLVCGEFVLQRAGDDLVSRVPGRVPEQPERRGYN